MPDVVVWIVGDALFTEEDRAYSQKLRSLVANSYVDSRVYFLGFRSDVNILMRAADIIAHCSVSAEPFGRVIVEGMFSGKPIIASRAGWAYGDRRRRCNRHTDRAWQ